MVVDIHLYKNNQLRRRNKWQDKTTYTAHAYRLSEYVHYQITKLPKLPFITSDGTMVGSKVNGWDPVIGSARDHPISVSLQLWLASCDAIMIIAFSSRFATLHSRCEILIGQMTKLLSKWAPNIHYLHSLHLFVRSIISNGFRMNQNVMKATRAALVLYWRLKSEGRGNCTEFATYPGQPTVLSLWVSDCHISPKTSIWSLSRSTY